MGRLIFPSVEDQGGMWQGRLGSALSWYMQVFLARAGAARLAQRLWVCPHHASQ